MKYKIFWFFKLILKISLIIAVIISFSVGLLLNFVLTPGKITPKIEEVVNEQIRSTFSVNQIELKFFSTFPNILVEIDNALIKNSDHTDSLIYLHKCSVALNPFSIVGNNKFDIKEIFLTNPRISAKLFEDGSANWDIIIDNNSKDSLNQENSETTTGYDYVFPSVSIINGQISFRDEKNQMEFKSKFDHFGLSGSMIKNSIKLDTIGLSKVKVDYQDQINNALFSSMIKHLGLGGTMINDTLDVDLKLEANEILYAENEQPQVKSLETIIDSKIRTDFRNHEITINHAQFGIEDIIILLQGKISSDSIMSITMDLSSTLEVSDLNTALSYIPEEYLELKNEINTSGEIKLKAEIKGVYNEQNLPTTRLDLKLKNGELEFHNLTNKVDLIETDINMFIDPSYKQMSNVTINHLELHSNGLELNMKGSIADLFDKSKVTFDSQGKINLDQLTKTFPLEEISELKGIANFNMDGSFRVKHVLAGDYGKINANGTAEFDNIKLGYKQDSLVFESKNLSIELGNKRRTKKNVGKVSLLKGELRNTGFKLDIDKELSCSSDTFFVSFKTSHQQDSTIISRIKTRIKTYQTIINLGDTLIGGLKSSSGMVELSPWEKNQAKLKINTNLKIDSLYFESNGSRIDIKNGKYNLEIIQKNAMKWPTTGSIDFRAIRIRTPKFPTHIVLRGTKIEVAPNSLYLNNAMLKVGRSEFNITGRVFDLQKTMFEQSEFKGRIDVTSNYIDFNQLTRIAGRAESTESNFDYESDSLLNSEEEFKQETFMVPSGLDLVLKSNFKKVRFGKMNYNNLNGTIRIKDQSIWLRDLSFNNRAVKMQTTIKYSAKSKNRAVSAFDLKLIDIDVANLVKVLPFLDTLLPMANSFDGKVDFAIKGRARLNKHMDLVQSSLTAISRVEGKNLVLMDGETFGYISKTLMFKNKERNIIDSAAFEMVIEDGVMELFPSLINIDRYRVAIGGVHNLDLTYDYHISVLKSPAPFKAGIDLFGDEYDYDYKISKAKYKNIFSDKNKALNEQDSAFIKRKHEIIDKLDF